MLEVVNIRMTSEEHEAVKQIAKKEKRSKSQVIRMIIEAAVSEYNKGA